MPHTRTSAIAAAGATCLVLALAGASAATVRPDLVTNGDFESPALPGTGWQIFQQIDGWSTTSGCGIEVQRGQYDPPSGDQLVELASTCPSAMASTIQTVPGWPYGFEYRYRARPDNTYNDSAILVSWDGSPIARHTSAVGTEWTRFGWYVRASAETTELGFKADTGPQEGIAGTYGGLLDWVRVIPLLELCSLNDADKAFKGGATAPLKVQLCDPRNTEDPNLSAEGVSLHAGQPVRVDSSPVPALDDSGQANSPSLDFRYDADLDGYVFNLSLKGYAPGTYEMPVTVSDGGGTYDLRFDVR